MTKNYTIAVAGTGYVGLSIAKYFYRMLCGKSGI